MAHEISSMLIYQNISLDDACEIALKEKLNPFGGHAGLIAIDKDCNIKLIHNAERMYRAFKKSDGNKEISLYK